MNQISLTPCELFFLGQQLKAQYIDYAYISIMPDKEDYLNSRLDLEESLSVKNYITADFSGEIAIEPEVEALLKPVFFGKKECAVDFCDCRNKAATSSWRYHFSEDKITEVVFGEEELIFSETTEEKLLDRIRLSGEDCLRTQMSAEAGDKYSLENPEAILAVKYFEIGGRAAVQTYFAAKGRMYSENSRGEMTELSEAQFLKSAEYVVRSGAAYSEV